MSDTRAIGAAVLTDVERFLARFVAYPSDAALVAHVLWIVHTHLMDCWESTPRIAFLSPEPGSGKSRALEVTEPLVPRPVHAVNTTPAYLFRKVSDDAGPPTILYDEIDTVFGPKAKDNEDIRGMLNAGHRKGAMAGRCVMRGKVVETEELPAYCAVALAGLDDLPDTLMTRSVVVRMRRRAPGEQIEPWRLRVNSGDAEDLRSRIEDWAASIRADVDGAWPDMPVGVEDRNADVWEALLAVADAAGTRWSERARVSAVTLVTQSRGAVPSMGVLLLRDLREVFGAQDRLSSETIINDLVLLPESPWGDLRGKDLDSRGLAQRLRKYDVAPKVIKAADGSTYRGYLASELHDAWARYLPGPGSGPTTGAEGSGQAGHEHVTCVTGVTEPGEVTAVAHVTHPAEPNCSVCAYRLDPVLITMGETIHPGCEAKPCGHPGRRLPSGKCGDCIADAVNARHGAA